MHDLWILTDPVEYPGIDQVFPMYPEQGFFLEELNHAKLSGAHVLEIGLGSGVLSIGALKAGASRATALEINPRAKLFAGFNALVNGITEGLCISDGSPDDLWAPVRGQQFDMIISNPPFMPTPDDSRHYFHSGGGGLLGMDFLETIFRELDAHLAPAGQAQIVTAAPGDDQLPTALLDLAEQHLSGNTLVRIDPLALPFEMLTHHLPEGFPLASMETLNRHLRELGITHQYLCVMHYAKGEKGLRYERSEPHPAWDLPLGSHSSQAA
ncbi:MAG: 50S ribosomal protein L11 methyltransferase [Cyanobium sp.]